MSSLPRGSSLVISETLTVKTDGYRMRRVTVSGDSGLMVSLSAIVFGVSTFSFHPVGLDTQ